MRLWSQLHRLLFDDSLARENQREVEQILRKMLELSGGDGDFDQVLRDALYALAPERGWGRVPRFVEFVRLNTRPSDRYAPWQTIVEHLLEDLPRIYGLKPENPRDGGQ